MQRLDYPRYVIDVDRAKAADAGLNQSDVMRNVVAAFNSSIQFNKKNFWIDPVSHNQYFVGVQYPEGDIKSIETLKNIPITSPSAEPSRFRWATWSTCRSVATMCLPKSRTTIWRRRSTW